MKAKKVILVLGGLIVVGALVVLSVPLLSSSAWRSSTTDDLYELYAVTNPNLEASGAFVAKADRSDKDYDDEMARLESSIKAFEKTEKALNDLGPNTLDVTGQYASTLSLKNDFSKVLEELIATSNEQVEVLSKEKEKGQTLKSVDDYSKAVDASSKSFAELEQLVSSL